MTAKKRGLANTVLDLCDELPESSAKAKALVCLLGGVLIGVAACGGSSDPAAAGASNQPIPAPQPASQEAGPAAKIVPIVGTAAVVALFPDGQAYYSPDGFNLGGGGSTILAYNGLHVADVVAVNGGVDVLLTSGTVLFTPDGKNLGGAGASVPAYFGTQPVLSLTRVGAGVDAVFASGDIYYSPDGLNLGGGGTSVRIYAGDAYALQIIAVGPGDAVVTLFAGGTAFYSPDNRNLGGGGSTISAAPGGVSPINRLVKVFGGVLAEFSNGAVYLSPDGRNLAGGGGTIPVPAWGSFGNGPFAPRDSARGADFLGRLWLSGGFNDPTDTNSCFQTCSYFDLWSSTDPQGTSWNSRPSFASATSPQPLDVDPSVNNGVPDAPVPSDFFDPYSALVVWNGQLTAIGSTVWRSADGVTWLRDNLADGVTAAPGPLPFRASENTRALILGGSLFVIQPDTGEVYRSGDPNAAVWSDLGAIHGFAPRCGAAVFTMQGKLWIEGGGVCDYSGVYNDMWSSPDGVTWTQSATPAAWSPRMWPCVATSADGLVWLATGYAPTDWNNTAGVSVRYGANHADLWYSRDGSDWKQFKADFGSQLPDDGTLAPMHAPTCYVTGDAASTMNLLIVAGSGGIDPDGFNARVLNSIRSLALPAAASLP